MSYPTIASASSKPKAKKQRDPQARYIQELISFPRSHPPDHSLQIPPLEDWQWERILCDSEPFRTDHWLRYHIIEDLDGRVDLSTLYLGYETSIRIRQPGAAVPTFDTFLDSLFTVFPRIVIVIRMILRNDPNGVEFPVAIPGLGGYEPVKVQTPEMVRTVTGIRLRIESIDDNFLARLEARRQQPRGYATETRLSQVRTEKPQGKTEENQVKTEEMDWSGF